MAKACVATPAAAAAAPVNKVRLFIFVLFLGVAKEKTCQISYRQEDSKLQNPVFFWKSDVKANCLFILIRSNISVFPKNKTVFSAL